MFRFEEPDHLFALILLPVLATLFFVVWRQRQKIIDRLGDRVLVQQMMSGLSRYKHAVKFVMLLLATGLLCIGWANPQWGNKKRKAKQESIDILIALDISQSMMAEDIPPNRMERAKRFAQNIVDQMQGNRIGLILFAGNAYLQSPLTMDYSAISLYLKSANPAMASTQGTAIGDAVELAEKTFEENEKENQTEDANRTLVIITDGENHEEKAVESVQKASENGMMVFTVGVGTQEGALIPFMRGNQSDYKRDKKGSPIQSVLNESMLQQLAEIGSGEYYNIQSSNQAINALRDRLNKLEKKAFETRIVDQYESYFQYFIALALFLLIAEFLISYRKSGILEGKDIFS